MIKSSNHSSNLVDNCCPSKQSRAVGVSVVSHTDDTSPLFEELVGSVGEGLFVHALCTACLVLL